MNTRMSGAMIEYIIPMTAKLLNGGKKVPH